MDFLVEELYPPVALIKTIAWLIYWLHAEFQLEEEMDFLVEEHYPIIALII
jgi:hypothetical protein